ncbi:hypothetical protein Pmani_038665 [Petrolisthes manimaculis]|uniref:Major facilitator superfamily (MFS) profile domain-containing protein n=1 Tax=Petrolisthes manimaculis TaxID=1843537 RepID=A0AAE1NFP3_9EUCA|nr:hypothetical protein Pmani_038665 [Petrolisthes manimaculis]
MGFLDLFGVSLILPLLLPVVKGLGVSHVTAGCVTSLYGAIQLFSSPVVDILGASLIIPLIILQVRGLGLSLLTASAINSVYGVLQVLSSPLVGSCSDVVGRRRVLLGCLAATALSYMVLGASHSLLIVIVARVIAGTFKHSQTICRALLADVTTSEDRSRVFGTFNATSSMGFIVGPMLGGHLSELHNGFALVCNLGAAIFIINCVLCWACIPENVVEEPGEKKKKKEIQGEDNLLQMMNLVRDVDWQVLWPIFTIRFLLSFSSLVYRSNFSLLIEQNFGAGPRVIGYLISFQGVISVMAGFMTGYISRYYHNSRTELYHSSCLLTLALVGLTVAPSLPLLLLFLVPLCLSNAITRVSGTAITISLCQPEQIGSVTGLGQSVTSVARMVTPLVAGVSQEMSVYGPGLMGAAAATIGATLARYMAHVHGKLKTV